MPLTDPTDPKKFSAPSEQQPDNAGKINAGRYGDLEEHELVRLLDTIEDERTRGRFRESIYISLIIYLAVAWFIFYGPRVLWHAPKLILPSEAIRAHEQLTTLNAPTDLHSLTHAPQPKLKPTPPPRVDNHTLENLRAMERTRPTPQPEHPTQPTPPAPAPSPAPAPAQPAPLPNAPQPSPVPAHRPPPPVADAPTPQPGAGRPSIDASRPSAGDMIREASRAPMGGGNYPPGAVVARAPGGGSAGNGAEILSDTQGVDFNAYLARLERDTTRAWLPLLPEEIEPPLFKKGETYIRITILPDGTVSDMVLEGSTHDQAIDRAAWGSILSQGKMQPLPRQFHGPNLILRLHYLVNMDH